MIFFHAEPLISRFSLEKYITLLQQLWQTVLMWNLYPIFISLNQLAVKITPAESFLWMHLHQFQYLSPPNIKESLKAIVISLFLFGFYLLFWFCVPCWNQFVDNHQAFTTRKNPKINPISFDQRKIIRYVNNLVPIKTKIIRQEWGCWDIVLVKFISEAGLHTSKRPKRCAVWTIMG